MRNLPSGWNTLLAKLGFTRKKRKTHRQRIQFGRRLRMESLEGRQMLAITVNTLIDEQDLDLNDGDVSLRDAIVLATAGETINFDTSLNGETITLLQNLGEIEFDKNLTIDGGTLNITIDADDPTAGFHNDDPADQVIVLTVEFTLPRRPAARSSPV